MAAAGLGNPVGAVALFDSAAPHIISGKVRNEIISGGVFVFSSGAADSVSSGAASFVHGDLLFTRDASGLQFNGICMQTTAVSGAIAVATKGVFILTANGTVTGGQTVLCDGNNGIADGTTAGRVIGRALTTATSGGYALVQIGVGA